MHTPYINILTSTYIHGTAQWNAHWCTDALLLIIVMLCTTAAAMKKVSRFLSVSCSQNIIPVSYTIPDGSCTMSAGACGLTFFHFFFDTIRNFFFFFFIFFSVSTHQDESTSPSFVYFLFFAVYTHPYMYLCTHLHHPRI